MGLYEKELRELKVSTHGIEQRILIGDSIVNHQIGDIRPKLEGHTCTPIADIVCKIFSGKNCQIAELLSSWRQVTYQIKAPSQKP